MGLTSHLPYTLRLENIMYSRLYYILTTSCNRYDSPYDPNKRYYKADHIICEDGTRISVQASSLHRCTPQGNTAPWSEVEACIINSNGPPPKEWGEYRDVSIYNYIPVPLIRKYIYDHGGEVEYPPDIFKVLRDEGSYKHLYCCVCDFKFQIDAVSEENQARITGEQGNIVLVPQCPKCDAMEEYE